MTGQSENMLDSGQLQVLTQVFHRGAADASVCAGEVVASPLGDDRGCRRPGAPAGSDDGSWVPRKSRSASAAWRYAGC